MADSLPVSAFTQVPQTPSSNVSLHGSDSPGEVGLECSVVFKSLQGILCDSPTFLLAILTTPLHLRITVQ